MSYPPCYFVNLTTGLEVMRELDLGPDEVRFCRLQSTLLEQKRWLDFLSDVPDDLLLRLARGRKCVLLDAGSRSRDGISRACWQGIPLIRLALERAWHLDRTRAIVHGHDVTHDFAKLLRAEQHHRTLKRFNYLRRAGFVTTPYVKLDCITRPSLLDGRGMYPAVLFEREAATAD